MYGLRFSWVDLKRVCYVHTRERERVRRSNQYKKERENESLYLESYGYAFVFPAHMLHNAFELWGLLLPQEEADHTIELETTMI